MILTDLVAAEGRLERLEAETKKGKKADPDEIAALESARDVLSADRLLTTAPDVAANPLLRNFALLTAKPILVLANVSDAEIGEPVDRVLAMFGLPVVNLEAARPDLYEYMEVFYNRKRRHSSNGYLSPVDYERLVLSGAAVAA